jgi:hypothetical protein
MMRTVLATIILTGLLYVQAGPVFAIHKTIPAETESTESQGITIQPVISKQNDYYKLQALINLLVNKGIISKEELQAETNRLKVKK